MKNEERKSHFGIDFMVLYEHKEMSNIGVSRNPKIWLYHNSKIKLWHVIQKFVPNGVKC